MMLYNTVISDKGSDCSLVAQHKNYVHNKTNNYFLQNTPLWGILFFK